MILLPLRPASLMQNNLWYASRKTQRSIEHGNNCLFEIIILLKRDFAVYTECNKRELYLKRAKSNLTEKCKKIAQK